MIGQYHPHHVSTTSCKLHPNPPAKAGVIHTHLWLLHGEFPKCKSEDTAPLASTCLSVFIVAGNNCQCIFCMENGLQPTQVRHQVPINTTFLSKEPVNLKSFEKILEFVAFLVSKFDMWNISMLPPANHITPSCLGPKESPKLSFGLTPMYDSGMQKRNVGLDQVLLSLVFLFL